MPVRQDFPTTAVRPPEAPARDHAVGPALAVVVLTWNGREDTIDCLTALDADLGPGDRVLVVDNGSEDGTEAAVRARFDGRVEFVQNGANLGFAGGNDVGLRRALEGAHEWVLLLNNDTVPPPGTLDALRAHVRDRPGVGAVQPLLVSAEASASAGAESPGAAAERIDSAGHGLHRLPGVHDLAAGNTADALTTAPVEIFGACGAAALLRSRALREAGLLDEELFVLFEDVDLMFRLRACGWRVELLPGVRVPHRRGVSGRGGRAARRRRALWVQRNLVTLALRWWPTWSLLAAAPLLLWRAFRAWSLAGPSGRGTCWTLWRDALRARRRNRAAMRAHGLDRWFGARPF